MFGDIEMNELQIVSVPEDKALAIFTKEKGLDPLLKEVFEAAESFVPDLSSDKGRKEIASMAYKVSQSKTAIDSVGKDLVSKLKEQPKLVDSERKRVRDILDDLRDKVRKPLTDWEAEEARRIDKIQSLISSFFQYRNMVEMGSLTLHNAEIFAGDLEAVVVDDSFAEFQEEAEEKLKLAKLEFSEIHRQLKDAEKTRIEEESAKAEAERKAQEEREKQIAMEAEQRAIKQAEEEAQKVQAENERKEREAKEAHEKRELELKLAAEQAERQKLEAEQKAAQAEEDAQRKIDEEKQESIRQEQAREANKKHRTLINNQALQGLKSLGVDEVTAKKIITAIAKKEIANVSISY